MTNDLEAIQTWLQSSYSVQVPPDWLNACVEWIQQENGDHPLSVAQLQPNVFEQWLMSDLKELGASCLPADLPTQHCTHITGPLALQVESMLDVGVPLYGQLQKVKGTLNTNSEVSADRPQQPAWEPKPSRMMLLRMTDGQTEVQGMEYRPIPALTSGLQPGFKVVVHGQVKCRRGVLMLAADNVQVLGGEVDSLIEANTPVAVLEQAMELSLTNNGKHEKKEFSGHFLKKQDIESGCEDSCQKKFKTEATTSLQRQGFGRGRGQHGAQPQMTGGEGWQGHGVKKEPPSQSCAWSSRDVKQEALSQPPSVGQEEEWEEDLDYGELLDEPMEEDLPTRSEPSIINTTLPQKSGAPPKNNLFACAPNAPAAKPEKSWQDSVNTVTSERSMSRNPSGSSLWKSEVTNSHPPITQQNCTVTLKTQNEGRKGVSQTPSSWQKSSHVEVDDSMWGDDDDFDLEQVEAEAFSPVIPVQTHLGQNTQNTKNSQSALSKQTSLQKSQSSLAANTSKPNLALTFGNSISVVNSAAKSCPVLQIAPKTTLSTSSKPQKPSEDTKPPPPKQRKLTAMFPRANMENKPAVSRTNPQPLTYTVVDLTDDRTASPSIDTGRSSVTTKETESVKQEGTQDPTAGTAWSSQEMVAAGGNAECQDADMADETHFKGEQKTGDPSSSVPEPQLLKDVLSVLQSDTSNEQTFTIKGHISTLTDRLRSCQGKQWSLSCRITDGSAAVEVAIADKVLTQLIGITAEQSITLRAQARKEASMKEFLNQGLQKCQQYLAEFSGLIEVQRGEGDGKPWLVNLVKMGTKQR
ncbi:hypothetical protein ACOMHN_059746 [Nucella lapillus]